MNGFQFFLLDPVRLLGDGQYNLNILTEIKATDDFIGLDKEVRKCQNRETYDDCRSKEYKKKIKQTCGCIPLSIGIIGKVLV